MAMEINEQNYSSYACSYINTADNKKKTTESSTSKETAETGGTIKKTAANELSYLSEKYSDFTFVAANYQQGMQKLDEENIRTHETRGRRMVAQGWAIDKNGSISRWGISEPTNKRHYGQEMTDYANKIREQKLEKKAGTGKKCGCFQSG